MNSHDSNSPLRAFSERPFALMQLPLPKGVEILRPEQVVVRVCKHSSDIGAYCFTNRSEKRKALKGRPVDLNSLSPQRIPKIRKIIEYFSNCLTDRGLRPATVWIQIHNFELFFVWAESAGCADDCLMGGQKTMVAFRSWVAECEKRFRQYKWSGRTAVEAQKSISNLLKAVTGLEDLDKGVRFLKIKASRNSGTEPAPEGDFAMTLALSEALFTGLSDLVLNHKHYPFKLELPNALGWGENFLWIFPTTRWCMPPYLWGNSREVMVNGYWVYDYQHGRIVRPEEIWSKYCNNPNDPKQVRIAQDNALGRIRDATVQIELANRDQRNRYRLIAAQHAARAFLLLFVAHTGLNLAVATGIQWQGDIEATAVQQDFRAIKWRASGKEVGATVRTRFLPLLKKFLALRETLLDGADCEWLFFNAGRDKKSFIQADLNYFKSHYNVLARIAPSLPIVSSRVIRATAHEWWTRSVDATLTARHFSHTEETVNRSYQAGSPVTQREEISEFFKKVTERSYAKAKKRILAADASMGHMQKGPVGRCEKWGAPIPIGEDVPVPPTCKNSDGCLFCERHVVKADEEDTRKLASCAYVIEQASLFYGVDAHFKPILEVIDEYLTEIANMEGDRTMVDRIRQDVFENGNLDPYWHKKLSFLDAIGVI